MSYEHNVFVSYKRSELWTPWVREKFVPRLEGFLQHEFGHADIFVDDQIQAGADWENVLLHKICRSKIMLSLISADYFHSDWCRKEMAVMLEREKRQGVIGEANNFGLLIPVRIGDGFCFPDPIMRIQRVDFERYADPDLPRDSDRACDFNEKIRALARTMAEILHRAPIWCEEWHALDGSTILPLLLPRPPAAVTPPRLNF